MLQSVRSRPWAWAIWSMLTGYNLAAVPALAIIIAPAHPVESAPFVTGLLGFVAAGTILNALGMRVLLGGSELRFIGEMFSWLLSSSAAASGLVLYVMTGSSLTLAVFVTVALLGLAIAAPTKPRETRSPGMPPQQHAPSVG